MLSIPLCLNEHRLVYVWAYDDAKKDFKTLLELLPADDSAESIRELYNTL